MVLAADCRVDNSEPEKRARLDVVIVGVSINIDLGQATLEVPQQEQPHGGYGAHNTLVLVAVNPLGLLIVQDEGITSKAGVDERIDKRRRKIRPGRVEIHRRRTCLGHAPAGMSGKAWLVATEACG